MRRVIATVGLVLFAVVVTATPALAILGKA